MDSPPSRNVIYKPVSTEAPKSKETGEYLIEIDSSTKTKKSRCGEGFGHYKECFTACFNITLLQFYNV